MRCGCVVCLIKTTVNPIHHLIIQAYHHVDDDAAEEGPCVSVVVLPVPAALGDDGGHEGRHGATERLGEYRVARCGRVEGTQRTGHGGPNNEVVVVLVR